MSKGKQLSTCRAYFNVLYSKKVYYVVGMCGCIYRKLSVEYPYVL